jgi:hypothetical protein
LPARHGHVDFKSFPGEFRVVQCIAGVPQNEVNGDTLMQMQHVIEIMMVTGIAETSVELWFKEDLLAIYKVSGDLDIQCPFHGEDCPG